MGGLLHFGTATRGVGGLWPTSFLLAVPKIIAHPSTASYTNFIIIIRCGTIITFAL